MVQIIIHAAMIAVFVIFGILFMCGKGLFFVAGYNMLPKEKKEMYDERRMLSFMAKMMFTLALCWCPALLGAILDQTFLLWIGVTLMSIMVLFSVIYANTGNRFQK